jgi:fructokinase
MQIVAMGELLWDVFPAKEFLGGAPLNFSAAAQRLGNEVTVITAVGDDERGRLTLASMADLRLQTDFVQIDAGAATGTAVVTTDSNGNAKYVFPRPAVFDAIKLSETQVSRLAVLCPEWIYTGTLALTGASNEEILHRLMPDLPGVRCFYDINLREGQWNLELVQRLSALASIVKLNEEEAETLFALTCPGVVFTLEGFCHAWSFIHDVQTICITLGSEGCAIFYENELHRFEGYAVKVIDTVGAGDAFAAAFLHGYGLHWPVERIASFANALGALVASRAGATPAWTVEECLRLMASRRS